MTAQGLVAIIFYSPDPGRLAEFYKNIIGIPFALNAHGNIREHFECSYHNIHFAILKRGAGEVTSSIVPSFRVDDIKEFVAFHKLETLHPVIELGGGSFVCSIKDADGNVIRLWMNKSVE